MSDRFFKSRLACNGVNGRPTRIEMPEEGKNTLSFRNHHKKMKVPYVIYADIEALIRKILGCEICSESKKNSYTEKTEWHEACGYSYMVVRSDGEVSGSKVYRGENAVRTFLRGCLCKNHPLNFASKISLPETLPTERLYRG